NYVEETQPESASRLSKDAQLYLDVFQKYSWCCGWNSWLGCSTRLEANVQRRCSADFPWSSRALTFFSEEITNSNVFWRYTDLCATRAMATFSSTVGSISNKDNQHVYNQPINTTFTHTEGK
nr:hypothetical protein [Tanacetum cinerariifolium]